MKEQMSLDVVNTNAAGIDIGSRSHWVAVGQTDEEIKEFGSTAILVSHRPDEVLSFSDKIVVIRKGKIIQKGTSNDIFFVADVL